MDLKSERVHQDLENQSDLKARRVKLKMSLARASKCNKRVKNGKKVNIQKMERELQELNNQINDEAIQSRENKENSSGLALSQKKCNQMDKVEVQEDENNSLEGITSLSSSPSNTGSEADSGISSLRGKNWSKTIPPYKVFKEKMDSLMQTLRVKEKMITNQNKLLEGKKKEITSQNNQIEIYEK